MANNYCVIRARNNFYLPATLRPDQINCLFHGSGGSIFLAFEKKNINWIGVVLPATRQWHLRITTVVPCEYCMEVALVS